MPRPGPATYGDLIAGATTAVETAQLASVAPFSDPVVAHAELVGYERFLHVAGVHLELLAGLARTDSTPLRKLTACLTHLEAGDGTASPNGRWYAAATLLGTAHDLLATHLHPTEDRGLLPRTPQAEEQLTPRAADQGVRHLTELVLRAAAAERQLVASALRSQRHLPEAQRPISTAYANHLTMTSSIEVYAMAALWDHGHTPSLGTGPRDGSAQRDRLAGLETAILVTPAARSAGFAGCLQALAVLRQLSYHQAHGTAPASPASLRDLALLGARFTATAGPLPEPQTPLQRVQHAHARDTLRTAHHAWTTASRELTTTIQGLTKAPAAYAAAIHELHEADPHDPTLRAAVLAALPRMGREASHTITDLGHTGALIAPHRDLSLRRSWQPLPADVVTALADRFHAAGRATGLARHAEQQLTRAQPPTSTRETTPVPGRTRQLCQGVHR